MFSNKKFRSRGVFFLIIFTALFLVGSRVMAVTKAYKNPVPKKDWTKYGINPWAYDTDNDGLGDDWEIKHGYCPTNYIQGVTLIESACVSGKIDLKKQVYRAPVSLQDNLPREINKFNSCADLNLYLKKQGNNLLKRGYGLEDYGIPLSTGSSEAWGASPAKSVSSDYSATNIQVQGVDELDMIKTDGQYIYSLSDDTSSGNWVLAITKAVPADKATVASRIVLDNSIEPTGLFLNGENLIVLGKYTNYNLIENNFRTVAQIYSIKDKKHPKILRSLGFESSLLGTRMIAGHVYLILQNSGIKALDYSGKVIEKNVLPKYFDTTKDIKNLKNIIAKKLTTCDQISYLTPAETPEYLEIVSFPVSSSNKIEKQVILGGGDLVYVSEKNLYVASTRGNTWNWWKKEMTDIHKFSLVKGKISLVATTAVPGTILNQFSMDEYKGKLRVVVTQGRAGGWLVPTNLQHNGLYIFNEDLNRIGWYDNFGEGEKIYSARFAGERAYVVTFLQTDPLFVFDLSNVREPKLMGELVIPGFSTYLHPYDANHLIGVGLQSATDTSTPGFTWNQGLKIGLFDVTDPTKPLQLFSEEIGDRGSYSEALFDHHAFLFSKSKNLLALPVSIAQLTADEKKTKNISADGKITYQGLFAYNVNLLNGFQFLGSVSHDVVVGDNRSTTSVSRSIYIGDYLYVFSPRKITIHKIGKDLNEVKKVILFDN